MVTERTTTIVIGKEQLTKVEAYLKSISTSLEALLDIYNLVIPKLVPDLYEDVEEEKDEKDEEDEEVCDCKKKEDEELETELKDILTKLLKLF